MATATNKQISIFREIGALFVRNFHSKTKLHYCVEKMLKRTEKAYEAYIDEINDNKVELASVDSEKNLIVKNGEYSYSSANQKSLNKKLRDLANKSVEIGTPHFSSEEIPEDLSFQYPTVGGKMGDISDYDVRFAFVGIVIPEPEEKE